MNFLDILFKRIEGFFKSMLSRLTTKLSKIKQLPVTAAKKAKDILRGMVSFVIKKPSELGDYVKLGGNYVAKRALLGGLLLAAAVVLAVVWLLVPLLKKNLFTQKLVVNTADFFTADGSAEVYTQYGTLLYAGRVSGGAAQGDGRLYDNGVLVYQGGFEDNEYSGNGKLYDLNGILKYEGGFSGSVYSGSGKLYTDSGTLVYDGDFSGGLYSGNGTEYYANGRIRAQGSYAAGQLNGDGRLYSEDGNPVYSGGFVNGKYSGNGELYENGTLKYVGGFVDGEMSGEGTEYSPKGGKTYSGGFSNGIYSGSGTLYGWNGDLRVEGQFEDGLANGVCSIFRSTGEQIFCGNMTNGEISWYSYIHADKSTVQAAFTAGTEERSAGGGTLLFFGELGCGFLFSDDGKADRMIITGTQRLYGAETGKAPGKSAPEGFGEPYDSYEFRPTSADRRLMKYLGIDAPARMICEKYISGGSFIKLYSADDKVLWYETGAV